MKADFFITYHHNDELAARWIAGVLKEVPFSILMESWDFLPGKNPIEKIDHMTTVARSVMVLLSGRFLQEGGDAVSRQAVMMPRPRPETYEKEETRRRMKIMLSISQSIVDASRLDLSSPSQAIHTPGLMNQTPTIASPSQAIHTPGLMNQTPTIGFISRERLFSW
jgi:hypothetical protein